MKTFLTIILFTTLMITENKASDSTMVLHYLVREPLIKTAKPPLLILLHGVGSNEEDLFSFSNQLPGKYLVVSARAPISLGGDSYAWYHVDFSKGKPVFDFKEEEQSREILIKFISQVMKKYAVNEKEIYLCGFSQGAIMSYNLGLTRPDLIKGIAVMSGRLTEEIKPLIQSNEKTKQLKVLIVHGTNDNTLPVHYAREAKLFLESIKIQPVYKEFLAAHEINREMLMTLINWLD
jgi:phospholipase/carboxylesterase